jgi:hypothetical protein
VKSVGVIWLYKMEQGSIAFDHVFSVVPIRVHHFCHSLIPHMLKQIALRLTAKWDGVDDIMIFGILELLCVVGHLT